MGRLTGPAMNILPALALILGGLCATPAAAQIAAGSDAPDAFEADRWFNWIGDDPNLATFEGRAVLLHYFAAKKPKSAQFLGLLKFWEDYSDKGLVILAVCPNSPAEVQEMLKTYPLPFPVAAGFKSEPWGIHSRSAQILIERKGTVYYSVAAANGIWNGKLLKGLKGSKRMGDSAYLRFVPDSPVSKPFSKVAAHWGAGELAKGLAQLDRVKQLEPDGEAERSELRTGVLEHIERLMEQIRARSRAGEPAHALAALEALAKDLKRHELGKAPAALLKEMEEDEQVQGELEANKLYEELVSDFFRIGWKKNEKRFRDFAKKYDGFRAAQKIQHFWIPRAW